MNRIHNHIKEFFKDDEKKLAFKISIASFVILFSILLFIIGASYGYTSHRLIKELRNESKMAMSIPEINPFNTENQIDPILRREMKRK